MMKEADAISAGKHEKLEAVIAINTMIRDGLR